MTVESKRGLLSNSLSSSGDSDSGSSRQGLALVKKGYVYGHGEGGICLQLTNLHQRCLRIMFCYFGVLFTYNWTIFYHMTYASVVLAFWIVLLT